MATAAIAMSGAAGTIAMPARTRSSQRLRRECRYAAPVTAQNTGRSWAASRPRRAWRRPESRREGVAGAVLAQPDVGGVDRGGADGDPHLARPGGADVTLDHVEDLGAAGGGDGDHAHRRERL